MTWIYDYFNPIVDGVVSWRRIKSCASDSKEGFEDW
jgi:hypothetical protein